MAGLRDARRPRPGRRRRQPRHDPRREVAGYTAGRPQAPTYPRIRPPDARPRARTAQDDSYGRGCDTRCHDKKTRKSFLGDLLDF
jgi:hypothetical protein